ncbi:RHS domain-containing protein [Halomonas sp. ANAO-440]|uniref:RHS repeat-associated core domain-containing protein n=1 Tax=Halomonas sp. ANAO-440 TaxID=2861360 RepID=UPI001CAA6CFC|nr:RHS repeat-associated core domain-containing protein [Halomonas sp. ANAO-440]MBZ0331983.1 RHS domain-containing protein [Halomonas sp. ANAO-440]
MLPALAVAWLSGGLRLGRDRQRPARTEHYRYDALGRRISKTVRDTNGTTATTHYGWDGDRIVREETDNQRITVVYEPGSFVPMLRIDETQSEQGAEKRLSAYITDALGTPMQLVTPRGDTLWQAQPDDWAAVKNERGNTYQPIRFQGQWYDDESCLYYNRHRYYDPQQGRYISQDPIGLKGGTNLYGYVTNPTGMVDPLGLSAWETVKFHSRMIPRFIRDEGMDVLTRTATVIGGGGQVLLGGALCKTVAGCVAGAPIAGLGASNIQEGFSESGRGFAREVAIDQLGEQWGNLAIDGENLGTSVGGLLRPVRKPETFQLFRSLPDDFIPAYQSATATGLTIEAGSSGIGVYSGINNYKNSDEECRQ